MALPRGTTGSLWPAFAPARLVGLAVKPPYANALDAWFPIRLRGPSRASVTFWEATAPVKLPTRQCPSPRFKEQVRFQSFKGGISRLPPPSLATWLQRLPPILHMKTLKSLPSYSKGSRGLSVFLRVLGIFTENSISRGPWLRHRRSRYAIRAGRNLPDKEFRYLRTVIVTAAVYWGFDSLLRLR
jgi:hypothetical protein